MILKSLILLIPLLLHSVTNLIDVSVDRKFKLIAHRGGVVEDKFAENSVDALEEAIKRNYWMIEVDIRETKDGIAIAQHDSNFKRFYNHDKKVGEMTWAEISALRSSPGNRAPLSFEEFVKMCQGKIFLMLDTKEPHSAKFCGQIESILSEYKMLESSYVIGSSESRKYFLGKAKVGAGVKALKEISSTDNKSLQHYFLFEHGNVLEDETLKWSKTHNITVVPSINKFHYKDQSTMMDSAKIDIIRLRNAGVSEFQIDSEFDQWFWQN